MDKVEMNQIAFDLFSAKENTEVDEAIKAILKNKQVLARLMKACIKAYRHCDIEKIMSYIEDGDLTKESIQGTDPNIKEIKVKDSNGKLIQGVDQKFDLLFQATTPAGETIYVNVEGQCYGTRYPLINRAIDYVCSMIHQQVIQQSHYEKKKKVYSIWICMNGKGELLDSIDRYPMISSNKKSIASCELENIIFFNISRRYEEGRKDIIGFLNTIFSNELEIEKKLEVLIKDHGIKMTKEMKEGQQKMSTIGVSYIIDGIEIGYERGMKQGINQGISQGIEKGKAILLINLFTKKLGNLSKAMIKMIETSTSESLDKLSLMIFEIESEEDIMNALIQ